MIELMMEGFKSIAPFEDCSKRNTGQESDWGTSTRLASTDETEEQDERNAWADWLDPAVSRSRLSSHFRLERCRLSRSAEPDYP